MIRYWDRARSRRIGVLGMSIGKFGERAQGLHEMERASTTSWRLGIKLADWRLVRSAEQVVAHILAAVGACCSVLGD